MAAVCIANVKARELMFVDDAAVTSYTLDKQQDHVLTISPDDMTLSSTSELRKTVMFSANRWAYFVGWWQKSTRRRKSSTLSDASGAVSQAHWQWLLYVSLTSGVTCVNIHKFYVPYGLCSDHVRPSKSGIALRLDKWAKLVLLLPSIHASFPALAKAKCCIDEESHMSQIGWLNCSSCFPFDNKHSYRTAQTLMVLS